MKYFVTGSQGFIGTNLITRLESDSYSYSIFSGDVRNTEDVNDQVKSINPDVIIHLAAFNDNNKSLLSPKDTFDINVNGTLSVLEAARQANCKVLIPSTYYLKTQEFSTPYILSKKIQEQISSQYRAIYKLDIQLLRLSNVYGANLKHDTVLQTFAKSALRGEQTITMGNLKITRDFIYIDDVIEAILRISKLNCPKKSLWEVGSGTSSQVLDAVNAIKEILNSSITIEQNSNLFKSNSNQQLSIDITQMKNELNWTPSYHLRDGLKAMLEKLKRIYV